MASRALRKAQREREEQERVEKLKLRGEEEGIEEDEAPRQPVKTSAFAMLGEEEDENEGSVDAAREQFDGDEDESQEATVASASKSTSNKKKRKKKKAKTSTKPATHEMTEQGEQLDEIDEALRTLATNGTSLPGATTGCIDKATEECSRLLAVDSNHLHAQNEMRRLFGRAALGEQNGDDGAPNGHIGGNRRQQRRVQQVGLAQALRGHGGVGGRSSGLAAMALKRNLFVQGKEDWPIAIGGGLGMEMEEKRADGTVLYKFVHNRVYQDIQTQFEMAVESMDPNRLVVLLQHNPYHISTLLQVSEIAKQERDHTTSGDLLERALFSFGRAVHSTFAKTLAGGKVRLDFARPENREFWLASWRYMQNLSMRATWRTGYEWAKLLLSLSPGEDPYAMWVVLDQYALRARQDLDYLNISRNATFKAVHGGMPNIQLSSALAEFRAGNKGKGRQALFTAVGRFPWLVARLMQELSVDAPPGVWGKEPRTEKERLYSEMYATRAKDLWNTPEMSALLLEVASALPPDTPSAPLDDGEIEQNVARHVLLSDTPALIALVPRKYTTQMMSASDPLPPPNSYPSSTSSLPRPPRAAPRPVGSTAENLRELQNLYGFFSNLFPWFNPTQGEADDQPQPTQDDIEHRIRDSGLDDNVIAERTRRLVQLQNELQRGPDEEQGGAGLDPATAMALLEDMDPPPDYEDEDGEGDPEGESEGDPRQARVEDVPDSGD